MDQYVTGSAIRRLREEKGLTQTKLAEVLGVSDKAVSKWETGRGYPDITLLEPLAAALGVSTGELLSGASVTNRNRGGNLRRSVWYVCPACGNVIHSIGAAVISCCGITLPPLEAESEDAAHQISLQRVEDEYYVTVDHEMSKSHFISFLAFVSDDRADFCRLYPEGAAHTRFFIRGHGILYGCCNRHGLFSRRI